MNSVRSFLALVLLTAAATAQQPASPWDNPLWLSNSPLPAAQAVVESDPAVVVQQSGTVALPAAAPPYNPAPLGPTQEIHPEIAALAAALGGDATRIFNHVHNHIEYACYHGLRKGPVLTLLEGSGNDYDQAALLVELLRAGGHTAVFAKGVMVLPYTGSTAGNDLCTWLGLPGEPYPGLTYQQAFSPPFLLPNTQGLSDLQAKRLEFALRYFRFSGYPLASFSYGATALAIPRVFAVLVTGETGRVLDPAFKRYEAVPGLANLAALSGYDRTALLNAVSTTAAGADSYQGLADATLQSSLTSLTTATSATLQASHFDKSVMEITGARRVIPVEFHTPEDISLPGPIITNSLSFPTAIDAAEKSTLTLSIGSPTPSFTHTLNLADLAGRRLSMTFSGSTVQLWLDDEQIGTTTAGGTEFDMTMTVTHPSGGFLPQSATNRYRKDNQFMYALVYSFDTSARLVQQRHEKLKSYRDAGKTDDSREVRTESLNIMGLTWLHQTNLVNRICAADGGLAIVPQHRFGRVGQEEGFYIDVTCQMQSTFSLSGNHSDEELFFQVPSLIFSAMEHGIIEQMQPGTSAVSTVGILRAANASGQIIRRASPANWGTVKTQLTPNSYPTGAIAQLDAYLTGAVPAANRALLPSNGNVGMGIWNGTGYVIRADGTAGMMINGGYQGGWGLSQSWIAPTPIFSSFFSNPVAQRTCGTIPTSYRTITSSQFNAARIFSADPIDMATGAFTYGAEDLTTGTESAPRGLAFSRSYTSLRRDIDDQAIGRGWSHNLDIRLKLRTATEEALAMGAPAQCAPLLTAIPIILDLYRADATPKEWGMAVHTAGWLVDQMKNNAASIRIGPQAMQFLKMPDGTYVSPPGSTASLALNQVEFTEWLEDEETYELYPVTHTEDRIQLTERHGNTITFFGDSTGNHRADFITDPDEQKLAFAYLSATADAKLDTVTDAYGRKYTFGYTGDHITSVTETAGTLTRAVSFGYDGDSNLTSSKDPENKYTYFDYALTGDPTGYAKNSLIRRLRNHSLQTVVETDYDSLYRAWKQRTHGDAAKTTTLAYTGYATYEADPAGGVTTHFFDEHGRSTGVKDPDGRLATWEYDGRDQIIKSINGEGEETIYHIDANLNLTQIDHPLGGGSTVHYFDALLRPTDTVDPDGRTTTLQYDAGNLKNRPDHIVHPIGTTNITYHTSGSGIGRPHQVTDPDNLTTTHTYDSFGQAYQVTQPGTFTTTYTTTARGDVTDVTDPRNITTHTVFNNRRQPTQITGDFGGSAPAVTDITYDDQANLDSQTSPANNDSRRVKQLMEYSPTGKLRYTRHTDEDGEGANDPSEEITYDNRDWQQYTYDIARRQTTSTPSPAGVLLNKTVPLGRVHSQTQDGAGRLLTTTTPGAPGDRTKSQTYTITSTAAGDHTTGYPKTTLTTADNLTAVTETTRTGQVRYHKDRRGNSWEFRYDTAGRPWKVIRPTDAAANRSLTTTYTNGGRLEDTIQPSGKTTHRTYNPTTGRPATLSDSVGTINYTAFDNNGNLLTQGESRSGSTYTTQKTYDRHNRLESRTDEDGQTIGYRYYPSGQLRRLIYPGGNDTSGLGCVDYTYWTSGRLYQVIDRLTSASSPRVTTYTWYPDGRLQQIDRPNNTRRAITYDDAGRPYTITETHIPTGALIHLQKLTYYPSDEVRTKYQLPAFTGGTTIPPPALTGLTFDISNQLQSCPGATVAHDPDGNMTTGPVLPLGSSTLASSSYDFDARNRLLGTTATGTTYTYDSENYRKTLAHGGVTTTYLTDTNGISKLLARTKNGVTTRYVWGVGLCYEIDPDGIPTTYHFDATGSTIALTDTTGKVTERIEYSPYGLVVRRWTAPGSTHDTPFLYTGMLGNQTDPNGLIHMRARYYSPLLGRFINADPAMEGSNWYAYAGGNPLGYVDPTGLGIDRALDVVQTALSFIGLVPGLGGIVANVFNAAISIGRGNYGAAALYTAAAFTGGFASVAAKSESLLARSAFAEVGSFSRPAVNIGGYSAANSGITLEASAIRFSQSNVRSTLPEITASMKASGWQGAPIDVVRMGDGTLTAVYNTRLAAAMLSNTPVQATIRGFGEAFPAARAWGKLQGETWGEALLNRIGNQNPSAWRRLYPNGSPFTGVHPSTPSFTP